MTSFDWLLKNRAATSPDHDNPVLRPRFFPVDPRLLFHAVRHAIPRLAGWRLESTVNESSLIMTRATGLFGFVDDIRAAIHEHPAGALLAVGSASRVGKGDLGQNRRNILELFAAVGVELMEVKPPEGAEGLLVCHYTPHPLDKVADVMFNPASLEKLSPDFPPVKIKEPADRLDVGGRLVIEIGGLVDWVAEFTEWNPPQSFADRQVKGPFELFEHRHTFTAVDGGTVIADRVHYQNKLGAFGKLFSGSLLAGAELQKMFAVRGKKLDRWLMSAGKDHADTQK